MYVPGPFAESDAGVLYGLMRRHDFATLITVRDGVPFASHLPFLVEEGADGGGRLLGHVARANPQWRGFDGVGEALAIFQGAHAYVSPRWYATAPSVPTWNYAAVHVYGAPRVVDAAAALDILGRLASLHEAAAPDPWRLDDLPAGYRDAQLRGIVAFEMPIARLEGKFKLNQNKTRADRAGVVAGLRASGDPLGEQVSRLMAADDGTEGPETGG